MVVVHVRTSTVVPVAVILVHFRAKPLLMNKSPLPPRTSRRVGVEAKTQINTVIGSVGRSGADLQIVRARALRRQQQRLRRLFRLRFQNRNRLVQLPVVFARVLHQPL